MNNTLTNLLTTTRRCLPLLALPLLPLAAQAQSVAGYTGAVVGGTGSSTYAPLKPTTTIPAVRSGGDENDGYYNTLPIGFTFNFAGTNYTTFSVSTNGWLTFGQALTDSAPANDLTAGSTRPIVAPFWDDLSFGMPNGTVADDGNLFFETTGAAGSRICTIEWRNVRWNAAAPTPALSFLVRLNEGSNVIDFAYAQASGSATGSGRGASAGIAGAPLANYLSATALNSTSATFSSTTETTTISTRPSNGRRLTFTPGALATRPAEALATFQLTPNPATTEVRLVGHQAGQTVQLFDNVGKLLRTQTSDVLDLRGLSHGLYLVRVGAGCRRLVVE